MLELIATGYIGGDPEIKPGQNGGTYLSFSFGAKGNRKDEPTTWFSVSYNDPPPWMQEYLKKGSNLIIVGRFGTYPKQDGTIGFKLNAKDINFAESGQRGEVQQNSHSGSTQTRQATAAPGHTAPRQTAAPRSAPAVRAPQPQQQEEVENNTFDEDIPF